MAKHTVTLLPEGLESSGSWRQGDPGSRPRSSSRYVTPLKSCDQTIRELRIDGISV